jgi:uncharacterized protein YeaO (DUF488 family)
MDNEGRSDRTMAADVAIKRIYDPVALDDGARILVDRIWPRGVSKQAAALTMWFKEIAPSTGLRKWFDHDPARFVEFRHRYRAELGANAEAIADLQGHLTAGRVTLLYAAHDPVHNHAIVLADYLRHHAGTRHVHPSA